MSEGCVERPGKCATATHTTSDNGQHGAKEAGSDRYNKWTERPRENERNVPGGWVWVHGVHGVRPVMPGVGGTASDVGYQDVWAEE